MPSGNTAATHGCNHAGAPAASAGCGQKCHNVTDKQDASPFQPEQPGSNDSCAPARVVAIETGRIWLEPLQTGSCGGCAAAASCATKGIGSLANRLEARRFAIAGNFPLAIGDQVEVAFGNRHLIGAAAVAYVIPLFVALLGAAMAQALDGRDASSLLGALLGLLVGFAVSKLLAKRLETTGALQARIVRQHRHIIHFPSSGAQPHA